DPHARVRLLGELPLEPPEIEGQGHQPLLCSVVEVALESLPLVLLGLEHPGPRRRQLVHPGAQIGLQARVLERDAAGGRAGGAAPRSSGSSSRPGSWSNAATGAPSRSIRVTARVASPSGRLTGCPSRSA